MGDVIRSVRESPLLGYTMKIEPFSLLSKLLQESGEEQYESGEFKVGGYNWKMMLYPNGNKKSDVDGDYISVYLAMTDAEKLTRGSEVNVLLKFFILDQIKGKYITFEDGRYSSFNAMTNVRGISRMLSLDAFRDPANGYIIYDCCTFGVEVMVVEPDRKGEKLTIIQNPDDAIFSWKLAKFSTRKDRFYLSDPFAAGGFKWRLKLYTTGNQRGQEKWMSIYLAIQDRSDLRPGWKVYATFKIVMKDQLHNRHKEKTFKTWFCASPFNWVSSKFIKQADMENEKKGFNFNDTVSLEAEITFMSMLNPAA